MNPKMAAAAWAAVLGAALAFSPAWAQGTGESPMRHPMSGTGGMPGQRSMGPMGGMQGKMGMGWMSTLTHEQRMRLNQMHLELKKTLLPLKAAKAAKKAELSLLLTQDKPDRKAIHRKIQEIAALKQKMMEKKMAHKLEVREMLTPDQRRLFDMHLLRNAERGWMMGGMGCPMMQGMMGGGMGGMTGGGQRN